MLDRIWTTFQVVFFVCSWTISLHGQHASENQVYELLRVQKYEAARALFAAFEPQALFKSKLAYCSYQLGRWKEASDLYIEILQADSLNEEAHLYLGNIYLQGFQLPKAIRHLSQLVVVDSANVTYRKLLGSALLKADLDLPAFEHYSVAHALSPSDISVHLSLVNILLGNGEFEMADSFITKGLELDSTNIQLLLLASRSKYGLKDYSATITPLEKCMLSIDLPVFYQKMLGYAYLQIDSLDLAIHTLQNLLFEDQSEYAYAYLAKAHSLKEQWKESEYFYKKAIQAGKSDQLAMYHLGSARAAREQGDLKAVINDYEEAFRYGGNPSYLFLKAQACEQYYKDKQVAIGQYRRFLKYDKISEAEASFAKDRIRLLREYLHQAK